MNPRIYVLTLVTFAFGSGAFIFAGLLESLAADLGVTTAVAGQLQTVFVLTSAVLGPVAAWLFGRVDRKIMVMAALALGLALHLACASAPAVARSMAFRTCGRSMTTVVTAPRRSIVTLIGLPSPRPPAQGRG